VDLDQKEDMTLKIVFIYDGYASLNGTPDHLVPRLDPKHLCDAPHGLSGTEVNMFGLARELGNRGHTVSIFSKWTQERRLEFEGNGSIQFVQLDHANWQAAPNTVIVSYHDARPLEQWSGPKAFKIAHHQSYGVSPQEDARKFADLYWTPTERVSNYHRERRGWEVITIPNAWDFGTFKEWKPTPGRLIYHTSMERGFHRLVEAFPHIKKQVPEAHIVAFGRGGPQAFERMKELCKNNVELVLARHSSRNFVLEHLAAAACFAYPCDVPSPCEVWPMSVTDALATGVPVVLAPDDGIERVFEEGACIVGEVKTSEDWLEDFVESTVNVLKNKPWAPDSPGFGTGWSEAGKKWATPYTFKNQCDRFLEEVGKRI
jgi:glycosyltransferase involved in cell wall biosynthesis